MQEPILRLLRKDYRSLRPSYEPFAVSLWIEAPEPARFDLDNVAKACLDALNGAVWHDDKQVQRLAVEKLQAETAAVTIAVEPYAPTSTAHGQADLADLLLRIDSLESPAP